MSSSISREEFERTYEKMMKEWENQPQSLRDYNSGVWSEIGSWAQENGFPDLAERFFKMDPDYKNSIILIKE